MINDISGFGLSVSLIATNTFPAGITLTQFADDADPFDIPSIQFADAALGLNGDMVAWSTNNIIQVTINIIPNSDDDRNLEVLAMANRTAKNKRASKDTIIMTATYATGRKTILSDGIITDAIPVDSIASAGRIKTKPYIFRFASVTSV